MATSQEYLEEVWSEAKKIMPGWMYAILHLKARARAGGRVAHRAPEPSPLERLALPLFRKRAFSDLSDDEIKQTWECLAAWHKTQVRAKADYAEILRVGYLVADELALRGLKTSPAALGAEIESLTKSEVAIVFVSSAPDDSEEHSKVFLKKYLKPLGLSQSDVWEFSLVPEITESEHIEKEIEVWSDWAGGVLAEASPNIIVSLGRTAKGALGPLADFAMPHPSVISKRHDSGEIGRKIRQIKKRLAILDKREKYAEDVITTSPSNTGEHAAEMTGGTEPVGCDMLTQITKADPAKRLVYGVVMDPYGDSGATPDAHNDYLPPAMIEAAAHDFMRGERVIGRQHETKTNAEVIESWVEMYPSADDYQSAIKGLDHSVLRRPFGNDVVHSGSWILGVKLGDAEWAAYEAGDLNAFSPGGTGLRQEIEPQEMPTVKFIDLVEQPHG